MKEIEVSEMPDKELIALLYEIINETEARMIYGRTVSEESEKEMV